MQPFTELRLRLRHAGYEPVPLIGKAPSSITGRRSPRTPRISL